MTHTVNIIRLEHARIERVLSCLAHFVEIIERDIGKPEREVLFSIVDYLEGFVETFHHPKEEDHLFKALHRRNPDSATLIDLLYDEHAEGIELLTELRAALVAYKREATGDGRLIKAAKSYIKLELDHMHREEQQLLPLALEALTDEDWREIDVAFARNEDPLFGARRKRQFDALYAQICMIDAGVTGLDIKKVKVR